MGLPHPESSMIFSIFIVQTTLLLKYSLQYQKKKKKTKASAVQEVCVFEIHLKMHFPLHFCCLCLHCRYLNPLILWGGVIWEGVWGPHSLRRLSLRTYCFIIHTFHWVPPWLRVNCLWYVPTSKEAGCLESCMPWFSLFSKQKPGWVAMLSKFCRQGLWKGGHGEKGL